MKKGQGQMIAFVLLIGFTVVIGIMVGGWMMKQSGKFGEKLETQERSTSCMDVAIVKVCDNGALKIRNKGYFTITKLKIQGMDIPIIILPNEEKPIGITLNIGDTVIPFIEIKGKEVGCATKAITIDSSC